MAGPHQNASGLCPPVLMGWPGSTPSVFSQALLPGWQGRWGEYPSCGLHACTVVVSWAVLSRTQRGLRLAEATGALATPGTLWGCCQVWSRLAWNMHAYKVEAKPHQSSAKGLDSSMLEPFNPASLATCRAKSCQLVIRCGILWQATTTHKPR